MPWVVHISNADLYSSEKADLLVKGSASVLEGKIIWMPASPYALSDISALQPLQVFHHPTWTHKTFL